MLKGGIKSYFYFILALPSLAVFFCCLNLLAASTGDLVINEIAWMGNLNSSNDEWIELKNLTDSSINLEGWVLVSEDGSPNINLSGSISANGFFILERFDDDSAPGVTADLIYSGVLGNSGEVLELRDADNVLINKIDASSGWSAGDNDTKQTMALGEDGAWVTSEDVGGTPGDQNISPQPAPITGEGENSEEDDIAESQEIETDTSPQPSPIAGEGEYDLGDVLINEFVSDPADGEVEWLELYNNLDTEINLEGWTIEEGSGAITKLEGVIGISGDARYMIVEKPSGNLNNKGDVIILRDSLGKLIDKVVYGNWDDGDLNSNAPVASDPSSIARKISGYNSFNNKNDFVLTTNLTKGSANIIEEDGEAEEDEISAQDRSLYDYSEDIVISEIFPNPVGSDVDDEFIELFNRGTRDVDLMGWRLGDESKKRFEIKMDGDRSRDSFPRTRDYAQNDRVVLREGGYLVIYRSESGIALNNTHDSVKLFRPLEDMAFEVVEYSDVKEGWSYNRKLSFGYPKLSFQDDKFGWSEVLSPGEENVIKDINSAPEISVDWPKYGIIGVPLFFDSSDTIDKENDDLKFSWDFGDGFLNILASPEHTYFKAGAFTVILSISDGINEVNEERIFTVINKATDPLPHPDPLLVKERGKVVINEILPNPEGTDKEGEWIELKNMGNEKVNLLNWVVDDSEGGSKPYSFSSDLWLEPGAVYTLDRVDSNIALNNSYDSVRLYNDLEELIDEIEYEKVVEGESYAKGENGKLFWTSTITPGSDNIIKLGSLRGTPPILGTGQATYITKENNKEPFYISLDKIKETESGDIVITKGVVSVLPGILGTQYFYIGFFADEKETESLSAIATHSINSGQAERDSVSEGEIYPPRLVSEDGASPFVSEDGDNYGIQIYSYKKDFPDLRVGDYIEVIGEVAVTYGEKRIKTKTKEDMVILERDKEVTAVKYDCININEEIVGSLIRVEGEIVERKSSVVYLDDGTDEIRFYIKSATGINPKSFKEGSVISATGIVGMTKSGIRVMPRSVEDIIKKDIESNEEEIGKVLGEVFTSEEWEIAKRDKKIELFKYILVIAFSIIFVLGVLLFRMRK